METSNQDKGQTYRETTEKNNSVDEIEKIFKILEKSKLFIDDALTTLNRCKSAISEKDFSESKNSILIASEQLQKIESDIRKYKDTYCTSDYNKLLNTIHKYKPFIIKKIHMIYSIKENTQNTFNKKQADEKRYRDANKEALDMLKHTHINPPAGIKPRSTNTDINIDIPLYESNPSSYDEIEF